MSTLIFELFSGVGFFNQLFSLETAIYLASISNRKLILSIKYPLCHCGKASWNYGFFLDFFHSKGYLQYLPNGIEIHYKNLPSEYTAQINDPEITQTLLFGNKFSQIGFIDKEIFLKHDSDLAHPGIIKFLNGRKPVIFDILEWEKNCIFINESNASRCFSNFLTTTANYQVMSNICESLTNLNSSFYEIFKQLHVPAAGDYSCIHFRFGDYKYSKEDLNSLHVESNYAHLFAKLDTVSVTSSIVIMSDRKDVEILRRMEEKHQNSLLFTEDFMKETDFAEHFPSISDFSVVSFILQLMICKNANQFIGHNGSTVSYYIQYLNFLNNKPHNLYSDRDVQYKENEYGWNTNGIPGGGIGWKLFFKDNIYAKKIKLITLTNDGYMNLTDNLLLSMKKLGIEQQLKIYCIGKKSHDYFKTNYFRNEVVQIDTEKECDFLETWVPYKSAQNKDTEGKKRWATITSYKMYAIHKELSNGNDVIFTDGDIVFERDPIEYMIDKIGGKDNDDELLIQNDEQENDKPLMCTGFFYMRSNENTINITNCDMDGFQNDQQYLRRFSKKIKHSFLDLDLFPNGKYFRDKIPAEPFIIHFNYDISEHKIQRMKSFQKWYVENGKSFDVDQIVQSVIVRKNEPALLIENNDSLSVFIANKGIQLRQGFITQINRHKELIVESISRFLNQDTITHILEIGFLAGHSAEMFLNLNHTLQVTSIDQGSFQSVQAGKTYIDTHYPSRHTLLKGNSNHVLREKVKGEFDIILFDGSYEMDILREDLRLAKQYVNENTLLIINGFIRNEKWIKYWNKNMTAFVNRLISEGILIELNQFDIDVGRGTIFCKFA